MQSINTGFSPVRKQNFPLFTGHSQCNTMSLKNPKCFFFIHGEWQKWDWRICPCWGLVENTRGKKRVFISIWILKIPIYCMSNGFFFHSWNHQHPKNQCFSSCSLYPSGKSWHKESSNRARWQIQVGCEKVGNCPDLLRYKKTCGRAKLHAKAVWTIKRNSKES